MPRGQFGEPQQLARQLFLFRRFPAAIRFRSRRMRSVRLLVQIAPRGSRSIA